MMMMCPYLKLHKSYRMSFAQYKTKLNTTTTLVDNDVRTNELYTQMATVPFSVLKYASCSSVSPPPNISAAKGTWVNSPEIVS